MSSKAFKWQVSEAVMSSELPPMARLLMLVFADLAGKDGEIPENRTPSLKDLERMTGMGKATVVRHKGDLVRLGWLGYRQPTKQQMSLHETGTYRIMVGRNPDPEAASQSETAETPPKKTRKSRPESQSETAPESQPETAETDPVSQSETPAVSERDSPLSHSETAIRNTYPDHTDVSAAADAAAHDDSDGLFDADPQASPSESEGQRTHRLAKTYTDRVKLSNFLAVRGIVLKAVHSTGLDGKPYTDQQITDALSLLIAERRGVTADTLRIALDGQPRNSNSNGHQPYRNPVDQDVYDEAI